MSAIATEPFMVRSLEIVAETDAHEGPVYAADEHVLYFTSVRRGTHVAIKRLELATGRVDVVWSETNVANGMALDRYGRLVVCEQGTLETPARITRLDRTTGRADTLVDSFGGLPLNSPNDVVVSRDGAIWFTDPSYGYLQGFRPTPPAPRRRLPTTTRRPGRRQLSPSDSTSRTDSPSRRTSGCSTSRTTARRTT